MSEPSLKKRRWAKQQLTIVGASALVPFVVVEAVKGLHRRFAPVWAGSALRATR
jgi:hypothetical protein